MLKNVQIDGSQITGWDDFHTHFSERLGFPKFYGRNMNAWIDCMTDLDDPDSGMTSVHVPPDDVLVLCISSAAALKRRCREIYDALLECSAFVNYRRIEMGQSAVVAVSFDMSAD